MGSVLFNSVDMVQAPGPSSVSRPNRCPLCVIALLPLPYCDTTPKASLRGSADGYWTCRLWTGSFLGCSRPKLGKAEHSQCLQPVKSLTQEQGFPTWRNAQGTSYACPSQSPGPLSSPAGSCLATDRKALVPGLALLSCWDTGSILTEAITNFQSSNSCKTFRAVSDMQ